MFAVLKTGGKQYKVHSGDVLRVEKLAATQGDKVQFNDILMLDATVGTPLVAGAAVQAEVIDQIKGDKVIHFVKRRRKHGSQRTKGHRQQLTLVKITDILEKGADKSGVKAAIGAGSAPAEAAPAKVAPAPKKAAKKAEAKAEAKAEPMAETKKAAPKKAAGAPAVADDLSAITGVGPAAVKKLVAAGIKTYAQLGGMSDDDIAAIGTIKIKPEWVAQANDLAKC
jgi:large subunit ribosomal protein L21